MGNEPGRDEERRLARRTVLVRAAAAAGLGALPGSGGAAWAAPADPRAGPVVTPDPIKARIGKSGIRVELVDFSRPPRTSGAKPYALLNHLFHAGDGSGRLFANDSRGKLWRIDGQTGVASLFLDLASVRGGAFLPGSNQMGLRSFAFHPDFARQGARGHRRLYTASTETAGSAPTGVPVFGGPFRAVFHDVVAEWSVDASGAKVNPASRRELLRVAQWKSDHNTDQLAFDPNAAPGSAAYGKLFLGVGDGGNNPSRPDPYDQAQDPGRALGKILRIDPLARTGGRPYGVPGDNPFVGRAGYLPEIWALGVRHPQNICFDPGGSGALILTDIGQAQIEEVNLGVKGANYGWPAREGTFVTDRPDEDRLYALPADDAGRGFTYPVAQYDHSEGRAIAGGFVYRGKAVPALVGHYLFGDIVNGRVFHVPVADLKLGRQATIRELTLTRSAAPVTLLALVAGSRKRVDLRFGQDGEGEVYILTKQDGAIRRLRAS